MWKFKSKQCDRHEIAACGCDEPERWWVIWKWIERGLFTLGLSLLALYAVARIESYLSSKAALQSFAERELSEPNEAATLSSAEARDSESAPSEIDFGPWSENRIRAYKRSISGKIDAPIAIVQIPKIHLEAPLFDGTDALTLNHAAGRIAGTARPGEEGNIGIAAHRDSFFRGLKDIEIGDAIELKTKAGTDRYAVDDIQIVTPDNVSVLQNRAVPSVTLVTCYPFYFVGKAPKRFVVTAALTQRQPAGSTTSETRLPIQISGSTKETQ